MGMWSLRDMAVYKARRDTERCCWVALRGLRRVFVSWPIQLNLSQSILASALLKVAQLHRRMILNHRSSPLIILTLVVFCPKWWIHYNSVKLIGISLCFQRAQVTLDQVHVRNLKFLCVSSEDVQRVIVNVKANTQTEKQNENRSSFKGTAVYCVETNVLWTDRCSHPASSIAAPMLRTPQPHPRSATSLPSMSSNVLWIV